MRLQSIPVVVGTMLIAAHGGASVAQRSDRIDALRQMATDVGRAVGAASVCREISWPRIKALTDRFSDLIQASAANGEEFSSIQQSYDQSAIDSQLTVSSKGTDCAAAVRDLVDLERAVTSPPPAAADTGATAANARAATVVPPPMTSGAAPPRDPRRRGR
jgi:branched-chain amino acid transport system substrate-binding protein